MGSGEGAGAEISYRIKPPSDVPTASMEPSEEMDRQRIVEPTFRPDCTAHRSPPDPDLDPSQMYTQGPEPSATRVVPDDEATAVIVPVTGAPARTPEGRVQQGGTLAGMRLH